MARVKTKLKNGKTAGIQTVGNLVKLKGENVWRRVNSDGTLTKVEDGKNGTIDYREEWVPKKVKKNTSWRIALANTLNPTWGYPKSKKEGYNLYKQVKEKQDSENITIPNYQLFPLLSDSVSNAAWRKYLGLNYNSKFLPTGIYDNRTDYRNNTVRLPLALEREIPVDTTFIKNRISKNKAYLNNALPKSDAVVDAINQSINIDTEVLNALRYTYRTGKPIGMNEHSYNSRQLIKDGIIDEDVINHTPLNVFQRYNIRYDKPTNRMYYSDEYGFDSYDIWPISLFFGNTDKFLEGQPFRFRGYIDLNKK